VVRTEPIDHVQRKQDHLRIVVDEAVGALGVTTGLERYRLVHRALPELDLVAIDTRTRFLGHALRAPLLISGMTGGVERGAEINRRLAVAAQAAGCAMGVGSQRVGLEDPSVAPTFRVRDVAPDILLLANLGAVQLNYGYGPDHCRRAVEMIDANALVLHLNPLQEALQVGGNTKSMSEWPRSTSVARAVPRGVKSNVTARPRTDYAALPVLLVPGASPRPTAL
jgi:isopentenyl-diphosphate delta-isomerase